MSRCVECLRHAVEDTRQKIWVFTVAGNEKENMCRAYTSKITGEYVKYTCGEALNIIPQKDGHCTAFVNKDIEKRNK